MRTAVRRTLIAALLVLAAALAWGLFEGGRYLQHEDPLSRADAIFVLGGSTVERSLEGVDLLQEHYAPLMVLSPGREEPAEAVLRARGARFAREPESLRSALVSLGIPPEQVLIPAGSVDNTADEGKLLRQLATQRGWRAVIVVTSKYHTRRTGFAMRRALDGSGILVIVRASRYDTSDPARWWRKRPQVRFVIEEWQKLIAYRLGLAE